MQQIKGEVVRNKKQTYKYKKKKRKRDNGSLDMYSSFFFLL